MVSHDVNIPSETYEYDQESDLFFAQYRELKRWVIVAIFLVGVYRVTEREDVRRADYENTPGTHDAILHEHRMSFKNFHKSKYISDLLLSCATYVLLYKGLLSALFHHHLFLKCIP